MRPETPILMITLQIPVLPDLSVDDVLEAIGQQVGEALETIRKQKADAAEAEEPVVEVTTSTTKSEEVLEPFTDDTRDNLLEKLGYAPMG